jgi:hypothetical protein
MSTPFLLKDVSLDAHLVKALASRAAIDPPSNLAKSTVHIFSRGSDSVVSPETVDKGKNVYAALAELPSRAARPRRSTSTPMAAGTGGNTPRIPST